jgi:hypothetical protein
MRIREDRLLVCGLPEDLDPQDRDRYERALFRLFFQGNLFVGGKDDRPRTFGTAMAPESPLLRAVAEEAILFADHVMRIVVGTCQIEAKQFFDAAVTYTEDCHEKRRAGSTLEFLEHCLAMPDTATTANEKQAQARAGSLIEGEHRKVEMKLKDTGIHQLCSYTLCYCRVNLSTLTEGLAVCPADTHPVSKVKLNALQFAIDCLCLKRHQAILSQSENSRHLLLAAHAASSMNAVRERLDPEDRKWTEPQEVPIERLLPALEELAAEGDFQDAELCAQLLEHVLSVEPMAVVILAELRSRYRESGDLDRLIANLERVADPPRKVIEYLRR